MTGAVKIHQLPLPFCYASLLDIRMQTWSNTQLLSRSTWRTFLHLGAVLGWKMNSLVTSVHLLSVSLKSLRSLSISLGLCVLSSSLLQFHTAGWFITVFHIFIFYFLVFDLFYYCCVINKKVRFAYAFHDDAHIKATLCSKQKQPGSVCGSLKVRPTGFSAGWVLQPHTPFLRSLSVSPKSLSVFWRSLKPLTVSFSFQTHLDFKKLSQVRVHAQQRLVSDVLVIIQPQCVRVLKDKFRSDFVSLCLNTPYDSFLCFSFCSSGCQLFFVLFFLLVKSKCLKIFFLIILVFD